MFRQADRLPRPYTPPAAAYCKLGGLHWTNEAAECMQTLEDEDILNLNIDISWDVKFSFVDLPTLHSVFETEEFP